MWCVVAKLVLILNVIIGYTAYLTWDYNIVRCLRLYGPVGFYYILFIAVYWYPVCLT